MIGPYRLLEDLGETPYGRAWKALDTRTDEPVVVQRVDEPWPVEAEPGLPFSRLLEETRRLTRIAHPGIPTLFEVGEREGELLVAVAPGEGTPLVERLAAEPRPDVATVVEWGFRLLEILAVAHGHGVIHRHVGEGEIRVQPGGRLTLEGFGLTRLGHPAQLAKGEPPRAPEQERGEPATPRTDLWAVGTLLRRLLRGRVGPEEPLGRVLTGSTAADPARRYRDAAEMEEALRDALSAPAAVAREVPAGVGGGRFDDEATMVIVPPSAGPRRGFPGGRLLLGAVLLVVLSAAGWLALHGKDESPGFRGGPAVGPRSPAALEVAPGDPAADLDRARKLILAGDETRAAEILEALLGRGEVADPVPVLDALGTLRLKRGETAEAVKLLGQAVLLKPSADLHYKLGLALAAEGRKREALEELEEARALEPGSEPIRRAIEKLRGKP